MRILPLTLWVGLSLLPQAQGAIAPAWKEWTQRPAAIRVDAMAWTKRDTNDPLTISLHGVALTNVHFGALNCSQKDNTNAATVFLKPNTRVSLVVSGALESTEILLRAQQPLNLDRDRLQRRTMADGRPLVPVAPDRYVLYLNGVEATNLSFANPNPGCSLLPDLRATWTVEVRLDSDQRRLNTRGRDSEIEVAENSAPGDGEWPAIGPARSACLNETAIRWSVGLGRLLGGKSAGRLNLLELGLTPDLYTPRALTYDQPLTNLNPSYERIVVVTNAEGQLRQILTPQTLVNIETNASYRGYEIQFHQLANVDCTPSNGPFSNLVNNPHVAWRFINPSPDTNYNTDLRIEERRPDGVVYASEIHFDGTNGWTLSRGNGAERRIETRHTTFTWDAATNLYRWETNEVKGADAQVVSRCVECYRAFEWGFELVSVATDTGPETLLQTFDYYTDSAAWTSYGKLHTIRYPDGYWERRFYHDGSRYTYQTGTPVNHSYDGQLAWVMTPWQNEPADPDAAHPAENPNYHNGDATNAMCFTSAQGTWYVYAAGPYDTAHTSGFATATDVKSVAPGTRHGGGFVWQSQHSTRDDRRAHLRQSSRSTLNWYSASELVTVLFCSSTNSEYAGQVCWAQPNYRVLHTNYYAFGQYTNGLFAQGPGRAWRMVSETGSGCMDRADFCPEWNWFDLVPGQSTREELVRQDGALVLRESQAYVTNSTGGEMRLLARHYYTNDCLGHPVCQVRCDATAAGPGRVLHTWDWQGTNSLPGPLLLEESDEEGRRLLYTYDSLKRLRTLQATGVAPAGFPSQPSLTTTFYYDAMDRLLRAETNAGGLALATSTTFDLSGRPVASTDHAGLVTQTAYTNGGRVTTTTLPSGAVAVRSNYRSRQLASVTGDADVPRYYEYGAAFTDSGFGRGPEAAVQTNTCCLGSLESGRFERTLKNSAGTTAAIERPGFAGDIQVGYFGRRQVIEGKSGASSYTIVDDLPAAVVSPGPASASGGSVCYAYDAFRNIQHVWTPGPADTCPTLSDPNPANHPGLLTNRVFTTNRTFTVSAQGDVFWVVTGLTYLANNSDTPTVLSVTQERLTGLPSNVKSEITTSDADGRTLVQTTYVDRDTTEVTVVTTASWSSLVASQIWVNGLLQSESTLTVAQPTLYAYDALRRQTSITSPLGAVSSTTYSTNTGQVLSTTDFATNTTTFEYYPNGETGAGQVKCVTRPGGKKTYYAYTNLQDLLVRTWGDVPYPEERVYNQFAELVELHTYRGGSGWSGAAWPASPPAPQVTTWNYQTSTGLLLSKTDALNHTVNYTYWPNGVLASVTRPHGTTTAYSYAPNGDLAAMDQTEGLTNTPCGPGTNVLHHFSEFKDYTRAAQPTTVVEYDAAALLSSYENLGSCLRRLQHLTYDAAGRLTSDSGTAGWFAGLTLTNHFDPALGRDALSLRQSGTNVLTVAYGYDAQGRLNAVTNGPDAVAYTYAADSDCLATTTFRHNGAQVLATTRAWDAGERLQSIANVVNTGPVTSHAYTYDALHRRTRAVLEDSTTWDYGYNDRDEVISGQRRWQSQEPVAGQQFQYEYDPIGNRTLARSGGDATGANLRTTTYLTDAANQYTTITNPAYKDVMGAALADHRVAVNGGVADRMGEYFHREITVTNAAGPCLTPVRVTVSNTLEVVSTNGSLLSPARSQTLAYDASGNLTNDGLWFYRWDSENRLVEMTHSPSIAEFPHTQRQKLEFTYDCQGRRIGKKVSYWNGSSAFVLATDYLYLYDGWNLIAILNSDRQPLSTFTWGLDLSGNEIGAGGVGGLLSLTHHSPLATHLYAYDGNGNVTALLNSADGSVSARYEYGPFGEPLRATGVGGDANPFGWSTKSGDPESGLLNFGYRLYSPALGRWLTQDPMEEEGGLNLYALCENSPVNAYDALGLSADPEDDPDDDLDIRLVVAAQGSGMVATYAYGGDLYAWHRQVTEEAWDTTVDVSKQIAIAVGMQVAGGVAGKLVCTAFSKAASATVGALRTIPASAMRVTVIGPKANFKSFAQEIGARFMNIPEDRLEGMATEKLWKLNKRFLKNTIARGDDIVLSVPVTDVNAVAPGFFRRELDYLIRKGYHLSSDGRRMIR